MLRLLLAISLLSVVVIQLAPIDPAAAHHILGRPGYSLDEDSNTPSSLEEELWIGDYTVSYMIFPAFPEPGKPARINLYVTRNDDGAAFDGTVSFTVRNRSWRTWFGGGGHDQEIGVQAPDDAVFRQGFQIDEPGDYVISAAFRAQGEDYVVDVPLNIGKGMPMGAIGAVVVLVLIGLVVIAITQRRRAATGKVREIHGAARRT